MGSNKNIVPNQASGHINSVKSLTRLLTDARNGKLTIDKMLAAAEQLNTDGLHEDAVKLYSVWLEHTKSPVKFVAWFNYGVLLAGQGDYERSIAAYKSAIELKYDFVQPRVNLGLSLERLGQKNEAISEWEKFLDDPTIKKSTTTELLTTALNHIGRVQEDLRDYGSAEQTLTESLAINPRQMDVIHHWVHLRQKQCKWPVLEELPGVSINRMLRAMSPLAMLAHADDPALQLLAAENCVRTKFDFPENNLSKGRSYTHDRIRIGYLSGDLCTHAVGMLLPAIFEQHDKSKFEIFAYDYSREDGTSVRERIKNAIEHFISVGQLSDEQVAQRILADEIDILVDLHGLSLGARPKILSYRPALVQATYLGYIGTTAMPWIDYVITDKYSLPPNLHQYYSEKPIYLDCACLPGDWQREIGPIPTRKEIGLPEDTFIFASFNNSYKLNEKIVSCWMEILKRVPSSLLWLVDDNPWATSNIKAYARSQGVSEGRLYFSSRVLPADYRARMKLADLFLDNAPSNAGSTASDVVWMGLPMLTISGRTFVSRMAGALLQYADVPELIANSYEDYIERAVFFAANANEFAQTRNRMLDFKNGKGNTFAADFVRSLEMRYAEIHAERTNVVNVAAVKSPIKKKIQNRHQNTFTLLIEGWRNINHSFAMVNQHQIIALAKIRGIQLRHRDYPFYLTHWQQTREGSGFTDEKLDLINGLQDCTYEGADVVYRIAAPIPPPVQNIKNLTFMVTELGLDKKSFLDPKFPISSYTDGGNLIITPSTWSRNRLVDYGFDPDGIRIIPHAVDKNTFAPLSQQERKTQRSVLGIKEDEIIVLNVGAPLWNKGIDILLKTVAPRVRHETR